MTYELRVRCCVCTVEFIVERWPVEKCPLCGAHQIRVVGEPSKVPDSMIDLRDRFAMAAIEGAAVKDLQRYGDDAAANLDVCAKYAERAYQYADAMLAERAKRFDGVARLEEKNDTERPPAFSEQEVSTFDPVVTTLSGNNDPNELDSAHRIVGATRGGE
jgi:hypothetical protein